MYHRGSARGASVPAPAPSAARVRPKHPYELWSFLKARGMLGVVVRSGRCLVHVVSIRGQGIGKSKPEVWNPGSGAQGGGKREQNTLPLELSLFIYTLPHLKETCPDTPCKVVRECLPEMASEEASHSHI